MIQIPNTPGKYQGEGLRIIVQTDSILIDTSGIQQQQLAVVGQPVQVHQQPQSTADRLASSTLKTTKFINDFLWGEGK